MKKITLLFLFVLSACAVHLHAQANLSYQGVIRNADGTAVGDGKYPVTFQLYEDISSGVAIWGETHNEVAVKGGIYSVVLGTVVPLDAPFNVPYFLGIAVDGGAELVPRIQLTSAPYALSLLGNSNVFPNEGNVGIGTVDPLEKLHVVGNVKIDGNLETTGGLGISFDSLTVDINTTGNITLGTDTLDVIAGEEQLRIIRGKYNGLGLIQEGTGFTVTKAGTGDYTVTFDTPFSSVPVFIATPYFSATVAYVSNNSTDFARVETRIVTNPTQSIDAGFNFIAIGPR